jgi:hypothetical protein
MLAPNREQWTHESAIGNRQMVSATRCWWTLSSWPKMKRNSPAREEPKGSSYALTGNSGVRNSGVRLAYETLVSKLWCQNSGVKTLVSDLRMCVTRRHGHPGARHPLHTPRLNPADQSLVGVVDSSHFFLKSAFVPAALSTRPPSAAPTLRAAGPPPPPPLRAPPVAELAEFV